MIIIKEQKIWKQLIVRACNDNDGEVKILWVFNRGQRLNKSKVDYIF